MLRMFREIAALQETTRHGGIVGRVQGRADIRMLEQRLHVYRWCAR